MMPPMDSLRRIAERVNKPLVLDLGSTAAAEDTVGSAPKSEGEPQGAQIETLGSSVDQIEGLAEDSGNRMSLDSGAPTEKVSDSSQVARRGEGAGKVSKNVVKSAEKRKVDPKNFSGEKKMSGNVVEVQSLDKSNDMRGSSRRAEPVMLSLPTSDRNVSADMTSIEVDPVMERISTVISQSAVNEGVIKSSEGILVQGTQMGDIVIDTSDLDSKEGTVVVSRTGVVKGDIRGKRVVIFGRVEGAIRSVTSLVLAESAVVTGDIAYRGLQMMDGSEVEGSVKKLKEDEI